jgi:hypothetical protein
MPDFRTNWNKVRRTGQFYTPRIRQPRGYASAGSLAGKSFNYPYHAQAAISPNASRYMSTQQNQVWPEMRGHSSQKTYHSPALHRVRDATMWALLDHAENILEHCIGYLDHPFKTAL